MVVLKGFDRLLVTRMDELVTTRTVGGGCANTSISTLECCQASVEKRRESEIEYLLNDEHLTGFTCSLLLQIAALVVSRPEGRARANTVSMIEFNSNCSFCALRRKSKCFEFAAKSSDHRIVPGFLGNN